MEVLLKQVSVGPCPLTLNTFAAELWLQAYQLLIPQSAGAQQQTSRYCCRLTGQTDGRLGGWTPQYIDPAPHMQPASIIIFIALAPFQGVVR